MSAKPLGLLAAACAGVLLSAQGQLPSLADDTARINRLTSSGVRLEAGRVIAWFPTGVMTPEEMQSLTDRLQKGVEALEAFLHVPRRWQDTSAHRIDYFFDSGAFFIPHATTSRQVLVPVLRLRDGKAPILHETTHALLTPPQGRRPLAWLTEGLATYVAKSVSAVSGIREGDTFELGEVQDLDAKCAASVSVEPGPRILPFIGAPGNLPALYAMEPAFQVRQTFYGCAASFTKYLVDRLGIERVVDVLPEADPHKELERLTHEKMTALRSAWAAKIGAKGLP